MFETLNQEPVVEEAEAVVETPEAEVSVEMTAPSTEPVIEEKIKDYLSNDLFGDIKTISQEEIYSPEKISEEVKANEARYEEALSDINEDKLIMGRVVGANEKEIIIDIKFKSEGIIDRSEFGKDELPAIGEKVEVYVERIEDAGGNTILSKDKADFMRRWRDLKEAFENETIIKGTLIRRIKGGMIVELGKVQAFLPGSQIDVRPIQDFDMYLNKELDLKIVKLNEARKNVVVSHKAILEETLTEQRDALFKELEVGNILEGRVKNVTDFGVFVDLGGIDGLLHITDLTWGRVNHPTEVVELDEVLTVKVIEYDEERKRVSLGLKQLSPHPWDGVENKFAIGTVVKGKVVSLTNYGCFIELEPGVEGLIHVSEISWTRHIKNPSEIYSMGDEIEAQVLSIDSDDKKISLGVKQLLPDPWDKIEEKFIVGSVHKGKIQNLAQFGAFAELEEGIDGLIHISDLSWTKLVKHPKEVLEKGQEVDVRVLEVSRENRRISLGYKQLLDDPWPAIIDFYESGKEVSGEIIRVLDKGIIIQLEMDVEGIIPFGKMSKRDRRALASQFEVGANLSGVVMQVAPEDRKVILFKEELAGGGRETANNTVKAYLKNQDNEAGEKLELPQELIDQAKSTKKEEVPKEA
ncbi:MAG: 30S ribosomal protein S1 [Candidatus Marinimicrobia bacterium]|jgi:small subunit ribosomal protein S1|nr:30S ribosomal protein S1 [Candidatus Neomarinimicrobiota bacterium]MBT3496365.1 30S ribosomal protein S1 [Candidatus Neomarinimicrobiota bacterium]MBT3692576.1 30S ribosomal protein S1 [Candidatus Neomarinimicrobiota bacterium]MBT3731995.1 30S ribosomal protein S1 [Candidatus Neomarinimicrobiota bacterium]MBT4145214.1 30S ribosomal protein S1 [Candidatus Neomarinimicrobiota bacterium]